MNKSVKNQAKSANKIKPAIERMFLIAFSMVEFFGQIKAFFLAPCEQSEFSERK